MYGILEYSVLEKYEPELIVVSNVVFMKDFGPWRKHQTAAAIRFELEVGIAHELLADLKTVVRSQAIKIAPDVMETGCDELRAQKCAGHFVLTLQGAITVTGDTISQAVMRLAEEIRRVR